MLINLRQIHEVLISLKLDDNSQSLVCESENLSQEKYLSVEPGNYLGAYIPSDTEPLQIVGNEVPQSALFKDTRNSNMVPFSELDRVAGGFLHLQADVGKKTHIILYYIYSIYVLTSNIDVSR